MLIGGAAFYVYTHFVLEHSSGHHRNVATREDPATARLGQTFYGFFPTSVYGGLKNTHLREVERIKTEYSEKCRQLMSGEKSSFEDDEVDTDATPILVLIYENRIVRYCLLHLGILAAIFIFFGAKAVIFHLAYSFVGVFFIELINYVEHYGLLRRKDARGIYEPITERHSWNSTSSSLLFRIQRHSDHHMHAYRPY